MYSMVYALGTMWKGHLGLGPIFLHFLHAHAIQILHHRNIHPMHPSMYCIQDISSNQRNSNNSNNLYASIPEPFMGDF